jgi:hypothetical protein
LKHIQVIFNKEGISKIEQEFDSFVSENCSNPFMLSIFIKKRIERIRAPSSDPIILVLKENDDIIGIAPFLLTRTSGFRCVKWLFDCSYSPDFILNDAKRKDCLQSFFYYIFQNLSCNFAILEIPSESKNQNLIDLICKSNNLSIWRISDMHLNHRIVEIKGNWDEFQKSRGKAFRAEFRSIDRKLSAAGNFRTLMFENIDNEEDSLKKIVQVENVSWKQDWRLSNNFSFDEGLLKLWEGSSLGIRTNLDFRRKVWFLELNGQVIAYSLVVEYGETGYIAKTSFNNSRRELYPGIYIFNQAVRGLFNSPMIKKIDFMTNLAFMKKWSSIELIRNRFVISKGSLPKTLVWLIQNRGIRAILYRFFPKLIQDLT